MSLPYELTTRQVAELLSRNTALGEEVSNGLTYGVPNLRFGLSFDDSVYGNVLISTDANGNIHIIGDSPIDPSIINGPTPSGGPDVPQGRCTDSIANMWGCLTQYAGVLIVGYFVYDYLKTHRTI